MITILTITKQFGHFFEHNNNIKEQKLEMEHNRLDITLPSNGYEPIIQDESLIHERKTEQEKNYRGKPKLLYNEPNNREQAAFIEIEANKDYTFQNHFTLWSLQETTTLVMIIKPNGLLIHRELKNLNLE